MLFFCNDDMSVYKMSAASGADSAPPSHLEPLCLSDCVDHVQALVKPNFLPGPWFEGAGTIKKTRHRHDPFGSVCGRVNKLITHSGLLIAGRTLRALDSASSEIYAIVVKAISI